MCCKSRLSVGKPITAAGAAGLSRVPAPYPLAHPSSLVVAIAVHQDTTTRVAPFDVRIAPRAVKLDLLCSLTLSSRFEYCKVLRA